MDNAGTNSQSWSSFARQSLTDLQKNYKDSKNLNHLENQLTYYFSMSSTKHELIDRCHIFEWVLKTQRFLTNDIYDLWEWEDRWKLWSNVGKLGRFCKLLWNPYLMDFVQDQFPCPFSQFSWKLNFFEFSDQNSRKNWDLFTPQFWNRTFRSARNSKQKKLIGIESFGQFWTYLSFYYDYLVEISSKWFNFSDKTFENM